MTSNPAETIDRLRDQIANSETLSDRDREALLAFSDRLALLRSDYTDQRHEKLLRHCAIMAGQAQRIPQADLPDVDLAATLDSRDAAEEMVRWINRRYENEETNKDYRLALRAFGKHVTDGDDIPDSLEWVPSSTSSNYQPKPDPGDMLGWEADIEPMLDETRNARDAAMIAVAWDSGARGGELLGLTIGDVSDATHGLQITVDGKTGQRSVTLMQSVPQLNRWFSDHPAPDTPDAPLWSKLQAPEPITHQMALKAMKTAGRKAGVTKPITFTNLRKSAASFLASRGLNQAHIEERLGWTRGSDVASRYVSIFSDDGDREVARIYGKDVDDEEPDPIAPVECPRCRRETPRNRDTCTWCQQALDVDALPRLDAEQAEIRTAVLRLVRENPALVDDIEEARELMGLFEDEPDLFSEAREFAAALDDHAGER